MFYFQLGDKLSPCRWLQNVANLIQNDYKLHFFIADIKLYTIFGVQLLTIKTFTHGQRTNFKDYSRSVSRIKK